MGLDILGLGHAALDYVGLIPYLPESNSMVKMIEMEKQGGGAASQAMVAASRLGAHTGFVGVLSDDESGRFIRESLIREKVDVTGVRMEPGKQSSTAFVTVEKDTAKRTIFVYPGTTPHLQIDEEIKLLIREAKFLHLDATTFEPALEAARIAKEFKVKVSLDGCEIEEDKSKTVDLIRLTDILVTNEVYPHELTGLKDPEEALLELAKLGPEIVLSTQGGKGCLMVQDGKVISFKAYAINAKDTTGAGDVFHGAFLYGLLQQHWSIEYIIKFAGATAAINCLTLGGRKGIPSRRQVLDFMRRTKI